MPEIINSPRFSLKGVLQTTIRHTVMPLVAGSAVAAIKTIQAGAIDPGAMKAAAITAALSGVARWLQFFCTNQEVTR